MDREKIMKALECLAQHHATCSCGECEYWDSRLGYDECERRMAPDIIALLKQQQQQIWELQNQVEYLTDKLKEQEAVVRCKDCKHWKPSNGHCPFNSIFTNPDWFCADGVAKDKNVLD